MEGFFDPTLSAMTDEQLVGIFRSGGEQAFEVLCSRYLGLISSLASRYRDLSLDADTGDLVQEGLISMLYSCKNYDPERGMSFKNYLMMRCRDSFNSLRRSSSRKGAVPAKNIMSFEDDDGTAFDPTECSPVELVESRDYVEHLHSVMKDRLSDLEYKVAVLHISGYSYKEISDRLNVTIKTVDNAQTRIRQKLSR